MIERAWATLPSQKLLHGSQKLAHAVCKHGDAEVEMIGGACKEPKTHMTRSQVPGAAPAATHDA